MGSYDDQLVLADWKYRRMRKTIDARIKKGLNAEYVEQESTVINQTITQLQAYFNGSLTKFDLPLKLVGTEFQQRVWQALLKIPFGETRTYLQLSKTLGDEKAIRAVASANGANAISVIIPCHRVIGSDGQLVGYAGGIPAKKKLLQIEGALAVGQFELLF